MVRSRAEGLSPLALCAAVVLLALPLLSQPWTIDEPVFVAIARHILSDPLHPHSFAFNWYGHAQSMGAIDGNPPLFSYWLAVCWRLAGGREPLVRLLLLPLQLLAAFGVYGLARRFTRRPLWAALAVVAGPAWAINMPHAMAEGLLAALAFPALYCALRGIDERDGRFYWGSAALFAGALLTKYAAVFLLAPALLYQIRRGVLWRRMLAYALACLAPLGLYLLHSRVSFVVAHALSASAAQPYAAPLARLRAVLAFTGGLGLCAAAWALPSRGRIALFTAAAAALFLTAPAPWTARVQGLVFGTAALCALAAIWDDGDFFLGAWTVCALALAACYWSVTARTTLFLLPPLTIAAARRLEARWKGKTAAALQAGGVAGLAALSLALARVDSAYARAQRGVSELVFGQYADRPVWCASHWGLQHYLGERGARELDWSQGGWGQARPGDVVVLSRVNSDVLWPETKIDAQVQRLAVGWPVPLRLMSGWGGQAGFYSNQDGFLPFTLSREPVDEFLIARIPGGGRQPKFLHGVHGAPKGPGL